MFDRDVVENALPVEDPAVSVCCVLAETDVGDDGDVGALLAYRADGRLHWCRGVGGGRPGVILVSRESEQQHGSYPVCPGVGRFTNRFVDRQLKDAGHGRDLSPDAVTLDDEQRIDQCVRGQSGFTYQ
jgi:hypothetical protein